MKFFDENYSQEIPTCIKYLRKKYNLKQSDPKKLDFLGSLHTISKKQFIVRNFFPFHTTPLLILILNINIFWNRFI